ncbi:MAG: DNA-binding domain-containing protein [Pseudomonadota bacterium]|nr:DNA-binding domain-containing protein [Pseudomonadota bacterium]
MSDLRRLQGDFLDALLRGGESFQARIVDAGPLDAGQRLGIYSNAYRARLIDALSDAYPSLHTLLGDEGFQTLGMAYIDARPSHHFSIRWFGDGLSAYLAKSLDYADIPVLAEMAAFEWALRDAFDAADRPTIGREDLQRIGPDDWADVSFRLHPSVRRLNLSWNVPQLWNAIDQGARPIKPEKNDYPIGWAIWRRGLQTFFRSLDVDEAWALDIAGEGKCFGDICAGLPEWVDELNAPQRAAGLIARWVEDALISEIRSGA